MNWPLILFILGTIITVILGIISFFLKKTMNDMEDKIEKTDTNLSKYIAQNQSEVINVAEIKNDIKAMKIDIVTVENENKKIRENYLDRFEAMNNIINQNNIQVNKTISDSKIEIIREISKIYNKIK